MIYWEEMQSKFGFNDGETIPPDAAACREVYVKAVNVIAEELGSQYELASFNRPGWHNHLMIISKRSDETISEALERPGGRDDALEAAIETAHRLELDDYVFTTASVRDAELDDLLSNSDWSMHPGEEETE